MKQVILQSPDLGMKSGYNAPKCRMIRMSLQTPVLSLSNPIPGAPGYYNEDDDIIIFDMF